MTGLPPPTDPDLDGSASLADAPLWAGLDPSVRRDLQAELERVAVPGGEILFEEGDPADALYMVLSGSLGISVRDENGHERRLARIFPPETIGEMALISDAPRSATAVTLRDSVLLKLTRTAFDRLVERSPPAMLYLARLLADRLRAANRTAAPAYAPTSFAVVPVTRGVDVKAFAQGLLREMRHLHGSQVEAIHALPPSAREDWLHRFEMSHRRVLYVSDLAEADWTDLCIRHADHMLMVGRPGEPLIDLPFRLKHPASGWRRRDLILLQAADADRPRPAHPSLSGLPTDLRLQARMGHDEDLKRIARTVSGRAIGLVLAGGGARGFAHLGVLRALREHNVPVDLVGGTSIGSVLAAAFALSSDMAELRDRIADAFVHSPPLTDYTIPLVALVRGHKVDQRLSKHFGTTAIEDLWLPFFCVSSNLTTGTAHIHRRGALWRALRASIAIPGLLPPAVEPEGILVDGAMMNNLPADVMAGFQRGPVLAVDVARDSAFRAVGSGEGRTAALRRVLGAPLDAPDIVSLLYRAATVSSDAQTQLARSQATVILHPPLADVPLRDWQGFERIAEIGYRHACEAIAAGRLDPLGR